MLPIQTRALVNIIHYLERLAIHSIAGCLDGCQTLPSPQDAENMTLGVADQLKQTGELIKAVQTVITPIGTLTYRRYYAVHVIDDAATLAVDVYIAEIGLDGKVLATPADLVQYKDRVVYRYTNAPHDLVSAQMKQRAESDTTFARTHAYSPVSRLFAMAVDVAFNNEVVRIKAEQDALNAQYKAAIEFKNKVLTLS